jgi:hypothetical protein
MIIKGGYIKNSDGSYKNINLIVNSYNWNYLHLFINHKDITKMVNMKNLITFEINFIDNNYILYVNDIEYHRSNSPFEFKLNIVLINLKCEDTEIITYF